jgi:hypothetical protein
VVRTRSGGEIRGAVVPVKRKSLQYKPILFQKVKLELKKIITGLRKR